MIASEEQARALGIEPLARIPRQRRRRRRPARHGHRADPRSAQAARATGVEIDEIDLVELNEAFASQSLAVMRELGIDPERVNVNGVRSRSATRSA